MVGTVKTRRTHYEVLGLEPTATGDEIERAFAGSISIFQPHGFSGVAEAAVAFRTLRDPVRRRAYDAELGLNAEPELRPSPMSWRVGSQFLTASGMPMRSRTAEPYVEPEGTPSIAAALRKLASPEPLQAARPAPERPAPDPRPPRPPEAKAAPKADPPFVGDRIVQLAVSEDRDEAEAGSIPWKPIGIVAGGVILAGAVLGGWAGWDAGSAMEPPPAKESAKAPLPPPTTFTVGDPAAAAPNQILDEVRPPPPKRIARATTRAARARPTARLADLDRQLLAPSEPSPLQPDVIEQAPANAPVTAAAANLPLPNRVIARTIERIGYPCGQVASTAQSGPPGAFRVTCTSGHSYQAAPVRGRYHFRRASSR